MVSLGDLSSRLFVLVTLAGMPRMSRSDKDCPSPQDYVKIFWRPSARFTRQIYCWFQIESGISRAEVVTLQTPDSLHRFTRADNFQPKRIKGDPEATTYNRHVSAVTMLTDIDKSCVCNVIYRPSGQRCSSIISGKNHPMVLGRIKLASATSPIHAKEPVILVFSVMVERGHQPQCRIIHRNNSYNAAASRTEGSAIDERMAAWKCTFTIQQFSHADIGTVGCIAYVELENTTQGVTGTADLDCLLTRLGKQFSLKSSGLVHVGCKFSTSCLQLPSILYIYTDTGDFNITTSKQEHKTVSENVTVVTKSVVSQSVQTLSIHLAIHKLKCSQRFTCGVMYQMTDIKEQYTQTIAVPDGGQAKIYRTVPARLSPVYTSTEGIELFCRGQVTDLPKMTLIWIFKKQRTSRMKDQERTESFRDNQSCPVYISMALKVPMALLIALNNSKFGCAVGEKTGDSPEFTAVDWTSSVVILECPLTLWWTKEDSHYGGTASLACHWQTICNRTNIEFEIFSDQLGLIATDSHSNMERPTVNFTSLTARSGEIKLTFSNFQSSDVQELACTMKLAHERSGQKTSVSENLTEIVCHIEISCNRSLAIVGSQAVGLCTWDNNCVGKEWYFSLVGISGTTFNSDTGPLDHQTVNHTSLSQASGQIMYTFQISCGANYTLKLGTSYSNSGGTEMKFTDFQISVQALPSPPVISRSTPPMYMLTSGVKEGSLTTLTCASDIGSMRMSQLVWHVVRDHEETLLWENVTTRLSQGPVVKPANCSSWEKESTIFVNLTRINTRVVFKCYVVHNPLDISKLSLTDYPSVESVPISVHYKTTTVMIDKVDYQLGDRVTLTCCAISHPPAIFLWQIMTRSVAGKISVGHNINSCNQLKLPPLRPRHVGTYRCLVKNQVFSEVFSAEHDFMLTLYGTHDDEKTTPEITTKVVKDNAGSSGRQWISGGHLGAVAATILFVSVTYFLCYRKVDDSRKERPNKARSYRCSMQLALYTQRRTSSSVAVNPISTVTVNTICNLQ